jgi:hypothetical protein
MASISASVPTQSGSRYLQQLCKHWGHKFDVTFDAERGTVALPQALTTMVAQPGTLLVTIDAEDPAVLDRMKGVVAEHLDRFAFKEAPLAFDWK